MPSRDGALSSEEHELSSKRALFEIVLLLCKLFILDEEGLACHKFTTVSAKHCLAAKRVNVRGCIEKGAFQLFEAGGILSGYGLAITDFTGIYKLSLKSSSRRRKFFARFA